MYTIIVDSKCILIIQNNAEDGPGLLSQLLNELAIDYKVVNLRITPTTTIDPRQFSAVVAFGGPDSANDSSQRIETELRLVKEAINSTIPFIGICLSLQIAVKAFGGNVIISPVQEEGFHDAVGNPYVIHLVEKPDVRDPLLIGLPDSFKVFEGHSESVEITKEMNLLGTGNGCYNQIVKITANSYGIQSHIELTRKMLKTWIATDSNLQAIGEKILLDDFDEIENELKLTGVTIFEISYVLPDWYE